MYGCLQRWFLRQSCAAFSVLEYTHPVSLMLAPLRHFSLHCSLIVTLHLVGAVVEPIHVDTHAGVAGLVVVSVEYDVVLFDGTCRVSECFDCPALLGGGFYGCEPAVEFCFCVSIQCVRWLADIGFSYHLSGRRVCVVSGHNAFVSNIVRVKSDTPSLMSLRSARCI